MIPFHTWHRPSHLPFAIFAGTLLCSLLGPSSTQITLRLLQHVGLVVLPSVSYGPRARVVELNVGQIGREQHGLDALQ